MQAVTEGGGLLDNPGSQPPPIRVQMGPHWPTHVGSSVIHSSPLTGP